MFQRCALTLLATALLSLAVAASADAQTTRKVRVTNSTTDAELVCKCVSISASGFELKVPQGQTKTQTNVLAGNRAMVIWEDLNEKVIYAEPFELKDLNLAFKVVGDATSGYSVAVETWTD